MTVDQCPASYPLIDAGARCRYAAGHLVAGLPHTTPSGAWWRDDDPEPDVSGREDER